MSVLAGPWSWSAFDGWHSQGEEETAGTKRPSKGVTWRAFDALDELASQYVEWRCSGFTSLLERWNESLHRLDGDPTMHDWQTFLPLHLGREEDWSDWLAYLLQTAKSPELAMTLFSRDEISLETYCTPTVEREVLAADRRADLVIGWPSSRTHVEVKVGDQNFAKTHSTAVALERQDPGRWSHYVLLPKEDIDALDMALKRSDRRIRTIIWDDVATGLRRSLQRAGESLRWQVLAHAFCGAIEQLLIGCPRANQTGFSFEGLVSRERQISIMQRAMKP